MQTAATNGNDGGRLGRAATWLVLGLLLGGLATAAADEATDLADGSDAPAGDAATAMGGEIDLGAPEDDATEVFWGPNRFGFGMSFGMALWERRSFDEARYLWDGNGDALLAMQGDYHRMFGDWFGVGGSVLFPTSTDASFLTGLALAIGPRVYLWPDWVYLQVEAVAGYPPVVGAIGTLGASIPLFGGARLRLENQFWLNILEDEAEFTFAWFPGFAVEMGF